MLNAGDNIYMNKNIPKTSCHVQPLFAFCPFSTTSDIPSPHHPAHVSWLLTAQRTPE